MASSMSFASPAAVPDADLSHLRGKPAPHETKYNFYSTAHEHILSASYGWPMG
jgi:hypothetical protein